ncbi:small, acid-soluble spore protein, alpha/beta type [Symbiobacterium thermophilum]|uniref:Small acid-soluble spore protein n=2 Tax=Symbiobacterium thermophilum TaxID=2734 RepID=Q67NN8_SYMTH|nr:small, acid-soluble spore protein, alpha/beta type [Symbiobacterium thermophilum]MBY6274670.1 small, acid-soluble spore protein, alpha/beta type [Symbiobacterium thermophilum]BAD40705.1 small acid-soluble spore protein [Symbiobacterium thermophilum IAM 14863]
MAQFTPTRRVLPHELLDRLKWEVAEQAGLTEQIVQHGWPQMSSRACGHIGGRIGGRMVKVMLKYAEQALAEGSATLK